MSNSCYSDSDNETDDEIDPTKKIDYDYSERIETKEIKSGEEKLLESLVIFYKKNPGYLNILSAVSQQKTIISLREIDYAVTNYSNNNKVSYKTKDGQTFKLYESYRCVLDGYSKHGFDPFRRRRRIFLNYETMEPTFLENDQINEYKTRTDGIITTVGQLHFFKWAILYEVIDFCFKNKESIVAEMELNASKKKKKTPKTPKEPKTKVPKTPKEPKEPKSKVPKTPKEPKTNKPLKDSGVSSNSNEIKVVIQFP